MRTLLSTALLCATLGCALAGCASGLTPSAGAPELPSATATVSSTIALAPPDPAFFLADRKTVGYSTITEYAANASHNAPPIRSVKVPDFFFGVDSAGNLYSTKAGNGQDPCDSPCRILVYNAAGKKVRSFEMATTQFVFVDTAGDVYAVVNSCRQIAEYAAGATGIPNPSRSIKVNPTICNRPEDGLIGQRWRLFADGKGGVYFMTSGGRSAETLRLLIWAPGAKGKTSPQRVIESKYMSLGVQGVDPGGNVWFNQNGMAYYFGPTSTGPNPTKYIALPGVGAASLVISSKGQMVYVTAPASQKMALLAVRTPGASKTSKTINLGPSAPGSAYGVTF